MVIICMFLSSCAAGALSLRMLRVSCSHYTQKQQKCQFGLSFIFVAFKTFLEKTWSAVCICFGL